MASEKKTTVHLSLSEDDKKALKIMAAERSTSASALIHEWIQRELDIKTDSDR